MGWVDIAVVAFVAVICIYVVLCFSWPETIFIKMSQRRKELLDKAKQEKDPGRIAV